MTAARMPVPSSCALPPGLMGNVVDDMPLATDASVQPAHDAPVHPRRFTALALIVMLLAQLALCSWFAVNKEGLFQDESYTYFLANGDWLNSIPEEGVVYTDGEPWHDWASVDSFLGIDPEMLYKNQESDNHPPLYYILFSLAYSLFPGSVDPVIGVALNIIFALITTVELYFLCRLLDVPKRASLLFCALWAVNPGMVNCMLYLRMYQLLVVFFLAAAIAAFSYIKCERFKPTALLAVFLATVGGLLTQYFFLFFGFALYLCCGIALLLRKRIAHAAGFAAATIGGVVAGILLFPPSVDHLFSSFRGQEALERAATGDSFSSFLVEDFRLLNSGVFGYLFPVIVALVVLVAFVGFLRTRHAAAPAGKHLRATGADGSVPEFDVWWKGIAILAISSAFYYVAIARVAPFPSIRYLMPVNAVLMLWPYAALYAVVRRAARRREVIALAATCAVGIIATVSGYCQGIKYFDQQDDAVAALASENDAMVALWQDPILQEAIFADALSYDESVYFNTTEAFEDFDFTTLGSDFTLYVQNLIDPDVFISHLMTYPDATVTYVGHNVDSSYFVYDVHISCELSAR